MSDQDQTQITFFCEVCGEKLIVAVCAETYDPRGLVLENEHANEVARARGWEASPGGTILCPDCALVFQEVVE